MIDRFHSVRGSHTLTAMSLAVLLGLSTCGGSDTGETAERRAPAATPAPAADGAEAPLDDPALAERGEQLFTAKACAGCHTIGGGRLTGPDLAGVTDRRDRGWILAMITRPDSMLREDQTARQLFMQYATPMPNVNITREEAAALYAYLAQAGPGQ